MYLRSKSTPTGNTLQLVESRRDPGGRPRQYILLSLGSVEMPTEMRAAVVRGVKARLSGQSDILVDSQDAEVAQWVDDLVRRLDVRPARRSESVEGMAEAVAPSEVSQSGEHGVKQEKRSDQTIIDGVISEQVSHQDTVTLGPVLVAVRAWESLGMPQLLVKLGLNPSQRMAITVDVINRLVDPVSENALQDWVSTTALPELLGSIHLPGGRDGYYRACDSLLPHRARIEGHLRQTTQSLLNLDRTILLYDLTNTYWT